MLVSALLVSGLSWFGSAGAQTTIDICAGAYTETVNGTPIAMWGYGLDPTGTGVCNASSPGPQLEVGAGDTTLTINLRNTLADATSLVIPGQALPTGGAPDGPVFFDHDGDSATRDRVLSFTHQAAAGGSATYTWNNVKSGTYAYQSGTHPAVQVQMGLYGALWQNTASGDAYDGVAYNEQAILLYSEIDPAMHAAIAGGGYGEGCLSPDPDTMECVTSTVDYAPRYFLVNGAVFGDSVQIYNIGEPGQRTLVRFINMGLKMHAPTINGARVQVVAEDGNKYPDYRDQYSVQLAAGKTKDAIISVAADAAGDTYSVYDRMLNLSNNGALGSGGMMSYLTVGDGAGITLPTALDDGPYLATEDTLFSADVLTGVLDNDSGTGITTASMVSNATGGNAVLAADGSFTYDPAPDFAGSDSFVYAVSDDIGSAMATATITVANTNDAPVATGNSYAIALGATLSIAAPGVLANDTDVDGDLLMAVVDSNTTSAILGSDGALDFTPGAAGPYELTYHAEDPDLASSNIVTVTIDVSAPPANSAPVAEDDFGETSRNNAVTIDVLANDTDDGTLDAGSIVITQQPAARRGSAAVVGGQIVFTSENLQNPNKRPGRGTATFTYTVRDNLGAESNEATVRVNVTR